MPAPGPSTAEGGNDDEGHLPASLDKDPVEGCEADKDKVDFDELVSGARHLLAVVGPRQQAPEEQAVRQGRAGDWDGVDGQQEAWWDSRCSVVAGRPARRQTASGRLADERDVDGEEEPDDDGRRIGAREHHGRRHDKADGNGDGDGDSLGPDGEVAAGCRGGDVGRRGARLRVKDDCAWRGGGRPVR